MGLQVAALNAMDGRKPGPVPWSAWCQDTGICSAEDEARRVMAAAGGAQEGTHATKQHVSSDTGASHGQAPAESSAAEAETVAKATRDRDTINSGSAMELAENDLAWVGSGNVDPLIEEEERNDMQDFADADDCLDKKCGTQWEARTPCIKHIPPACAPFLPLCYHTGWGPLTG